MPKVTKLDQAIDLLGDGVPDALKHLRAFLAYEGDNPIYYKKAKVGGVILGSYVKAEATKTNRMAVEFSMEKVKELASAE